MNEDQTQEGDEASERSNGAPSKKHGENSNEKPKLRGKPRRPLRKLLIAAGSTIAVLLLLAGAFVGYLYASSPISIREPLLEHYHFRMQILVNGKSENFGDAKYQTPYDKGSCNAALPNEPIHFHDNIDQFVHIHWEGITGGQVLKHYGWNFIGGIHGSGSLGYRFDSAPKLQNIPIHGTTLPAIPDNAAFHVFIRDGDNYKEKSFDDFTHQDLEEFFGRTSNFPANKLNKAKRGQLDTKLREMFQRVSPTAYAQDNATHHSGASHGHSGDTAELTRLNNLIGDVVLFVQKDKPSDSAVKDRFNRLAPLSDSTCGG